MRKNGKKGTPDDSKTYTLTQVCKWEKLQLALRSGIMSLVVELTEFKVYYPSGKTQKAVRITRIYKEGQSGRKSL